MDRGHTSPIQSSPCPGMTLEEFCDMEQLYLLLENWSTSTGMSAVIVDAQGRRTSESFGMTEFCTMVHNSDLGIESCASTWKKDHDGIYVCPMGFCDFSVPIVLPEGQVVGRVLAGQALSTEQSDLEVLRGTTRLGIDEGLAREVLSHVSRKSPAEMEGAYRLLKETIVFFVDKSYSIWKAANELKSAPAKQDRILSQITQIMYGYNLTVDLTTDTYTLIVGTGTERSVGEFKRHERHSELDAFRRRIVHPSYVDRLDDLLDFRKGDVTAANGFVGSLEYPVLYPGDEDYEWHEINVFVADEENGRKVAHILGRDVTRAHNAQEKSENELRAAAAKNQILSELTKMLYSYNLTLNLRTGKYSMIVGTGMTQFMEIFRSTDDYEEACRKKIAYLDPRHVTQFVALAGLDSLRARSTADGFIGSLEYGAFIDRGEEWHEINVFVGTDEKGDPIANILGRDITEAHRRQEQRDNQLKAAVARDQLLSGITKMLYSYNLTVNLQTWKYSLITGTGMDDILKTMQCGDDYVLLCAKLVKNVEPGDREQFTGLIGIQALKERAGSSGFVGTLTYRSYSHTGEWHEVNLFMGANEDGAAVANILGRDVTEAHGQQERRENELRAALAKDQILSNITKTLYSYNMTVNVGTGRFTLITGTGLERTVAELQVTDRYEDVYRSYLMHVDSRQRARFAELLSLDSYRGRPVKSGHLGTEEFLYQVDGGVEWHEINVFAGFDDNGEPIVNILGRDETEAHDKADTKAQLEIAKAANAAKTSFLFNMSHDIRTPMNAIIGFTELLGKHLDDAEASRGYVRKIQTASEFLLSLINNVLEMARIESGVVTTDENTYNIDEFWDELFALLETQARDKSIALVRDIRVEHHDIVADETKMREIMLNILSNAVKYTPAGGIVSVEVRELPSQRPGYACYQRVVEDTGIGITEDFLPHIFEEFSRERSSTESRVIGTGLGMPIVKRLVDLMGGTVEVQSEPGKGTRFTVTMEHRIDRAQDVPRCDAAAGARRSEEFAGRRILLAEDNELNAEIATTILEEAGFLVERAEDGVVCVDMIEKADPGYYDLVLMDIQMPNMDGYTATRTIRRLPDATKACTTIIAMTANAFEEDRRNAFAVGMNGHIAKPIRTVELLSTLAESLQAARSPL